MNKSRFIGSLMAAVVITLASSNAQAAFSLFVQLGPITDPTGAPITQGSVAFVADADQDGFGEFGLANSYESSDDGDVLLDVVGINNAFSTPGVLSDTIGPYTAPANTPIIAVFYNNDFATSPDAPGAGTTFGIADPGFVLDNPNAQAAEFFYTTFGGVSPQNLIADVGQVVPEPASLAVLGMGGLLIARYRRRA